MAADFHQVRIASDVFAGLKILAEGQKRSVAFVIDEALRKAIAKKNKPTSAISKTKRG